MSHSLHRLRRVALLLACFFLAACIGHAALAQPAAQPTPRAAALPANAVTTHTLALPDRTLHFAATAGAITLTDPDGAPQVAVAFIAYQLEGAATEKRPVTFVLNGGPGVASAWLQLGMMGPWRLPMDAAAVAPSAPPVLRDNADTWLDFTDLVFIDPVGTGYSRFLARGDDLQRSVFSVRGDIDSIAATIRHWLQDNRRFTSPKFIAGESYGGFRAPLLARALADRQGVGVSGLVMISPALDFGGRSGAFDPLTPAELLPSMVAVARAAKGPVTRADLADAEAYAGGEYLLDLVKGNQDAAAVARRSARVAALTGLDPALVRRHQGVIGAGEFLHEVQGEGARIGSAYDATVTVPDADPQSDFDGAPDPLRDAMNAPLTSAMLDLYARRLNWQPDGQYQLMNLSVNREWDFGRGNRRPESASDLREALALDPGLRVVVAQGLFDLVTPYYRTQLILDQIEPDAGADRVRLVVYPGGHMLYTRDELRSALRNKVLPLYTGH
jgi:carboxypeptidase C (cathepsin A)